MKKTKVICIITNSHSTTDVRLYHKLAKSLCKIGCVYVLGARGVGIMPDSVDNDAEQKDATQQIVKPNRIIVSGLTPNLRLFDLYRQALKLKPDLVVCIEPLTMFVGLKLKRKLGCKLVYDAHEYYTSAHSERYKFPFNYLAAGVYYLFEHSLQEKMDLTIAVNDDIFRMFNLITIEKAKANSETQPSLTDKYLSAPVKLGVICPNYPTLSVFSDDMLSCRMSSLLPNIEFDIMYLGGITEERGIMKLLQVIELLRKTNSDIKALFIGPFKSDEFKTKFYNYVMDNNLNSHVYWRDAIPHDKVCSVLKQVKVGLSVLHPKFKRYRKALPLKVLEYLASGVPVVANDFPQNKDIIAKHNLGYCVPFHTHDIAVAIIKLLSIDDSQRKALSDKCRSVIAEHYVWSGVEPVLLDAVKQIMKS